MDFGFACTFHHAVELAAIELRDEALDPSSDEERMSGQRVGGENGTRSPRMYFDSCLQHSLCPLTLPNKSIS